MEESHFDPQNMENPHHPQNYQKRSIKEKQKPAQEPAQVLKLLPKRRKPLESQKDLCQIEGQMKLKISGKPFPLLKSIILIFSIISYTGFTKAAKFVELMIRMILFRSGKGFPIILSFIFALYLTQILSGFQKFSPFWKEF